MEERGFVSVTLATKFCTVQKSLFFRDKDNVQKNSTSFASSKALYEAPFRRIW